MRAYYKSVFRDNFGNHIKSGTVSVYLAGTTTAASIYTSLTGTTAVNSVTSSSTDATFEFWVDRFDYDMEQKFKLVLSKSGYDSVTYDNVIVDQIVLGTYAIPADKTVTTHLTVPKGVIYQIATGKTLTINGPFEAGLYQVFSCVGTGVVTFGSGVNKAYPQWWGAIGDGVTECYEAFQAAASSGIKLVSVPYPASYYKISTGQIAVPSNQHWIGEGNCPMLRNDTNSAYAIFDCSGTVGARKSNILIENIGMRNGTATTGPFISGKDAILIDYVDNITIKNCFLTEMQGVTVIKPIRSTNIKILDNVFYRATYANISIGFDCENVWVERNYLDFDNYISTLYGNTYLISTGGNSTDGGLVYPKNVWIRGNVCINNPKWEGIDSHGCRNLWIEDNYIYNCRVGITAGCQGPLVLGTPVDYTAGNYYIRRNVIIQHDTPSVMNGYGIVTTGDSDNVLNNVHIKDNYIYGYSIDSGAIVVYDIKDVYIENNIIDNYKNIGIHLYHTIIGCTVLGNTIMDFSGTPDGQEGGIYINSFGIQDVLIDRNNIIQRNGIDLTFSIRQNAGSSCHSYIRYGRYNKTQGYPLVNVTINNNNWMHFPARKGDTFYDLSGRPVATATNDHICGEAIYYPVHVSGEIGDTELTVDVGERGWFVFEDASVVIPGGGAGGIDLITYTKTCSDTSITIADALSTAVTSAVVAFVAPTYIYHPKNILTGSVAWNPGSIADGDEEAKDVTVTGAALGDIAIASINKDVLDLTLTASVTVADTVTVVLANNTGGAVDVASGTVNVMVFPA
jgi:parallel beta-helix repeat protein